MISKLGVGILLSVATLFFATPTDVLAATSANSAKIKKYTKQLKKLANAASPASKVNSLVVKLTKLDPKKATNYYKIGLTKLAHGPSANGDATKIAVAVNNALKKADIPASQKTKIQKQVTAANFNYTSNPNNSASNSAMLTLDFSLLAV